MCLSAAIKLGVWKSICCDSATNGNILNLFNWQATKRKKSLYTDEFLCEMTESNWSMARRFTPNFQCGTWFFVFVVAVEPWLNDSRLTYVMHNYACIEGAICVNWPNFYFDDRVDLISVERSIEAPILISSALTDAVTWAPFLYDCTYGIFFRPDYVTRRYSINQLHIRCHRPNVFTLQTKFS